MSVLLQRARDSGTCPPIFLSEDRVLKDDSFDEEVLKVLDDGSWQLSPHEFVQASFKALLQQASAPDGMPGDDASKKSTLEQRRALLLAIVANTPKDSATLSRIVEDDFLVTVKVWIDDILGERVGGVNLLLHVLSSIADLPVTKASVKASGMVKTMNTIEKNKICAGTPNEDSIKSRVQKVKDNWNACVKAQKSVSQSSPSKVAGIKRSSEEGTSSPAAVKRTKIVTAKAKTSSSFSSLLTKITVTGKSEPASNDKSSNSASSTGQDASKVSKKSTKRVKWSDHFGEPLTASKLVEGEAVAESAHDSSVSWSDRKKRDRMREKELLSKVKKAKLLDDDDDLDLPSAAPAQKTMAVSMPWRPPAMLANIAPVSLSSSEVQSQTERKAAVAAANYPSEHHVPASPAPLSDVEQAFDMTAQTSAQVETIPFFIPPPAPAPAVESALPYSAPPMAAPVAAPYMQGATPEFVQSLGLPLFLVGQNMQALQTLAASPGLLSSMVDATTGSYDQARLVSLVQTLSGTTPAIQAQPPVAAMSFPPVAGMYGSAPQAPALSSANPSNNRAGGIYRGSSNSEGNLHVSGYGPSTTDADIINLFSPYVQVDEVVMKGTFAFVNTNDPLNAQRAREALTGTLLGGMPIRVNPAQRKAHDPTRPYAAPAAAAPSISASSYGVPPNAVASPSVVGLPAAHPTEATLQTDVDSVRDDRGNAATKNLFVAGYGSGTSEQQIREAFGQYANVIGVVSKGSFSFVNTSDKAAAVQARQMLGGTQLNGGVLRINFAKETGRLGTSFDLTYGKNTGPNAPRSHDSSMSYYGRGY